MSTASVTLEAKPASGAATVTPELAYDDGDTIFGIALPAPEDAVMPEDCLAIAPEFLSLSDDLVKEALKLSDSKSKGNCQRNVNFSDENIEIAETIIVRAKLAAIPYFGD